MAVELRWERIDPPTPSAAQMDTHQRVSVPGGWLVKWEGLRHGTGPDGKMVTSHVGAMIFVPDPEHGWVSS